MQTVDSSRLTATTWEKKKKGPRVYCFPIGSGEMAPLCHRDISNCMGLVDTAINFI